MSILASCSDTLRLWETSGAQLSPLRILDLPEAASPDAFCWDDSGQILAAAGDDGRISMIEMDGTSSWARISSPNEGEVHEIVLNKECTKLAAGRYTGIIEVWSFEKTHKRIGMAGHRHSTRCVQFFDGDASIVSAGEGGRILLHKLGNSTEPLPAPVHLPTSGKQLAPITRLAVTELAPRWVGASHADGLVRVWDAARKICVRTTRAQRRGSATGIAFHPQNHELVGIVGQDGFLRCLDLRIGTRDGIDGGVGGGGGSSVGPRSGEPGLAFKSVEAGSWQSCLSFSLDGNLVGVGCLDGTIRLVDLRQARGEGVPVQASKGAAPVAIGVKHVAFQNYRSPGSAISGRSISSSHSNANSAAAASVESIASGDEGGEVVAQTTTRLLSPLFNTSLAENPLARGSLRNSEHRADTIERSTQTTPSIHRLNTGSLIRTSAPNGWQVNLAEKSDARDGDEDDWDSIFEPSVSNTENFGRSDGRHVRSSSTSSGIVRSGKSDALMLSARTRIGSVRTGFAAARWHDVPGMRWYKSRIRDEWPLSRARVDEETASLSSQAGCDSTQELSGLDDSDIDRRDVNEHQCNDYDFSHYIGRVAQEERDALHGSGRRKLSSDSSGLCPGRDSEWDEHRAAALGVEVGASERGRGRNRYKHGDEGDRRAYHAVSTSPRWSGAGAGDGSSKIRADIARRRSCPPPVSYMQGVEDVKGGFGCCRKCARGEGEALAREVVASGGGNRDSIDGVDTPDVHGGNAKGTPVQGMTRDGAAAELMSRLIDETKGELLQQAGYIRYDMVQQFHCFQEDFSSKLSAYEEGLGALLAENQTLRKENVTLQQMY